MLPHYAYFCSYLCSDKEVVVCEKKLARLLFFWLSRRLWWLGTNTKSILAQKVTRANQHFRPIHIIQRRRPRPEYNTEQQHKLYYEVSSHKVQLTKEPKCIWPFGEFWVSLNLGMQNSPLVMNPRSNQTNIFGGKTYQFSAQIKQPHKCTHRTKHHKVALAQLHRGHALFYVPKDVACKRLFFSPVHGL